MKSRLTIDFRGLDSDAGKNQFEPVIRATVEDSDDPRDGLMKAFFEALGGTSNWLVVDINSSDKYGSKKAEYTIFPVTPNDFESTIDFIKDRLPAVTSMELPEYLDKLFKECEHGDQDHRDWLKEKFADFHKRVSLDLDDTTLPSRFKIGDKVEFSNKEYAIKKYGKIVAVKFTEEKVWYDILDTYNSKVIEGVDSLLVNKPSLFFKEENNA